MNLDNVIYSFDFSDVENDPVVNQFCFVFPKFPVKKEEQGKMSVDPTFINLLKEHNKSSLDILDLYDSLYELEELKDPYVDWAHIFSYDGRVEDAVRRYGRTDRAVEQIRLVYHICHKYVVRTYVVKPSTRVRFTLEGSDKYITLKHICDQLIK